MEPVRLTAIRRGLLSPAVMISTIALFAALGGTGYAALSNGARTATASGGILIENVHPTNGISISGNSTEGAFVTCPKGTYPVGGGFGTSAAGLFVIDSLPYNSVTKTYGGVVDSWDVWVQNTTSQTQTIEPYAVCATGVTGVTSIGPTSHVVGGITHTKPKA